MSARDESDLHQTDIPEQEIVYRFHTRHYTFPGSLLQGRDFMSTHKRLLSLISILAVSLGVFGYVAHTRPVSRVSIHPGQPTAVRTVTVVRTSVSSPVPLPVVKMSANASLTVAEHLYPLTVHAGETVLEAMRDLVSTTDLVFTGEDYPGLGFFVESINGKKNGGGEYWVFYVNSVSASVGVSTQTVSVGDTIAWKYEKGY